MAKILLSGIIDGRRLAGDRPEYPVRPEQLADSLLRRFLRRARRFSDPDMVVVADITGDSRESVDVLHAVLRDDGLPFMVASALGGEERRRVAPDVVVAAGSGRIEVETAGGWRRKWRIAESASGGGDALPPLTAAPFPFLLLETEPDGGVVLREERLRLPEGTHLCDLHNHTRYAYCCEDMTVPRAVAMGKWMGLESMAFTEHSSHLFFSREACKDRKHFSMGIAAADQNLCGDYYRLCDEKGGGFVHAGLEIDVDWRGNLVVTDEALRRAALRLASVHSLPPEAVTPAEKREAFLFLTEEHLRRRPDVLAHPFRALRREPDEWVSTLWRPVADLLARYGVAAEMNFLQGAPTPEFVSMCLDRGVRLSLGGDSHEIGMVGDFHAHLSLLDGLGVSGSRLDEVLWSPPWRRTPLARI